MERGRIRVRVSVEEKTYPDGWEGEGERWAVAGGAMAEPRRRKRLYSCRWGSRLSNLGAIKKGCWIARVENVRTITMHRSFGGENQQAT